jgi:hypothetical protein
MGQMLGGGSRKTTNEMDGRNWFINANEPGELSKATSYRNA